MADPIRRLMDSVARRTALSVQSDSRQGVARDKYAAIAELRRRHNYAGLAVAELQVFSQNGEDGVVAEIFDRIQSTNRFFVEFGVGDGVESNTRFLSEVLGWSGVYFEPDPDGFDRLETLTAARTDVTAVNEAITPSSINELFESAGVPREPDLISIDVDGQDYWIWEAMHHRPRVLIIEYNAALPPESRLVEPAGTSWSPERTSFFGASQGALVALGESKGYRLVHAEMAGVNLFFVRDDVAVPFEASLPRGANFFLAGERHPPAPGEFVTV